MITVAIPLHIEPAYVGMKTEEMSRAGLREPVTGFGLQGEGLHGMFAADVPRTPQYRQLYGKMLADLHFRRHVHNRARPSGKVGFHAKVTTVGGK